MDETFSFCNSDCLMQIAALPYGKTRNIAIQIALLVGRNYRTVKLA
jgi:hypothetical protein